MKNTSLFVSFYFNSIKVQLEHLNYAQAKNAYANFNSIKVQLEPSHRGRLLGSNQISIP